MRKSVRRLRMLLLMDIVVVFWLNNARKMRSKEGEELRIVMK